MCISERDKCGDNLIPALSCDYSSHFAVAFTGYLENKKRKNSSTHLNALRSRLSHTCVDDLGGSLEVVEPREAVGKHGRSAAGLLIASHAVHVRQPLRMHLRRQRDKYS